MHKFHVHRFEQSFQLLKLLSISFSLGLSCFQMSNAFAAPNTEYLGIVTGDDYPPYVDWKRPKGGIASEVVTEIVSKMGVTAQITVLPWARGYKQMLKGEYLATYPYIRTESREKEVTFSESLFTISSHIFVKSDSDIKFEKISDLYGRTTCNYVGSALPSSVQQLIRENLIKQSETRSLTTCFRLLNLGRVDFVTVNNLAGTTLACEQSEGTQKFLISEKPVEVLDLHLIVESGNQQSRKFLEGFNAELIKYKSTKNYQALKLKTTSAVSSDPSVGGFKKIACKDLN